MFNRSVFVVSTALCWLTQISSIAFQDTPSNLDQRLRHNSFSKNESFTLVESYANFVSDWNNRNEVDHRSSRTLRKMDDSLRELLDQVALDDAPEIQYQISESFLEQRKLLRSSSSRNLDGKAASSIGESRALYEKIREQLVPTEVRSKFIDTFAEQEEAVIRILSAVDQSDRSVQRLMSDLFVNQLIVNGPIELASQRLFRESMGWSCEHARTYFDGMDYEKFEQSNVAPIKRRAMAEFFKTLDDSQLDRLSRKLGIKKTALEQIADFTPASDLKRVFSNSAGKLEINYAAADKLKLSNQSALAAIRQFNDSPETDGLQMVGELQNTSTLLSAFPPGEYGDLSVALEEFKTEKSRLDSSVPKALREELSALIDKLDEYQRYSATPWKWPRVVHLKVRTSFGDLDDESINENVPERFKSSFSKCSSERNLPADPTWWVASMTKGYLQSDDLGLPANQLVEILNWQVDHPQTYEFENVAQRSADTKAQLDIVTDRLIPRQSAALSAIYAQYMFCMYGPYNYFQRPDIAAEFGITVEQKRKMDEVAKRISETIEDQVHPQVVRGFVAIFDGLTDAERQKFEKLLDCKINELGESILKLQSERVMRQLLLRPFGTYYLPRKSTLLMSLR